jgi:16S rRNA (uracil1498-N3)-methyltransferase
MSRFFVLPGDIYEDEHILYLQGEDKNHIKNVLRMRQGDELTACESSSGKEYSCQIEDFEETGVRCRIRFVKEADTELPSKVYLFQGLPKGDKLELVIQKCVELGVFEVIPVSCLRSAVKLNDKKAEKKRERWQQIAKGAAEQSHRCLIPEVKAPMSMSEALEYAKDRCSVKLIPYELCNDDIKDTRRILEDLKAGEPVAFFIGPEGGFDEKEIEQCVAAGFIPITLGRRILRTETAPITIMSWLSLYL